MKKKLIAVLLTASMVISMTACGSGNSSSSSGSSGSGSTTEESGSKGSTEASNDGGALRTGRILTPLSM